MCIVYVVVKEEMDEHSRETPIRVFNDEEKAWKWVNSRPVNKWWDYSVYHVEYEE